MFSRRKLLTNEEKEKISTIIQEAEKKTSGEIVIFVVHESDDYIESHLKSALFFNLLSVLFIFSIQVFPVDLYYNFDLYSSSLLIFTATAFGFILCYIPFFKKLFISKADIDKKVNDRAKLAFLDREVFKTKQRTGILIFLSFFEKKVVVLADSGIHQKVKQESWQEVVKLIINGIHNNDLASGIKEAVHYCGNLLETSGLTISRDDQNELSNEIIEKND